jgi:hypothetical protein
MLHKLVLPFSFFLAITFSAQSQRLKVKRKGVTPLDVTKITPAQSTYSLQQLSGKWQEVSRLNSRTNAAVNFNDTLFYNFSGENVYSRDGVNMSLLGQAAIDPGNVLVAAADVFTIRQLTNNQVVLDDGEYTHTLVRKNHFWSEFLPTNAVVSEKFTTPITINSSLLAGRWKVYRRDAKPGKETNRTLIRILNITDTKNNNSATGEITFYRTEKLETLPCTITLNGDRMQISTAANTWNMNVYKADGKDLVFGDQSLMYYCKPL